MSADPHGALPAGARQSARTWTRVVAAAVGLVLALVGGLWLWGWTRPAGHVAEVTRTVPAPPAEVWAVVVDFDHHADWRTAVTQVRRDGDRVEETDPYGEVLAYRIEVLEPERRLVTRIVDQTAFSGTWTLTLQPEAAGTRLTIVERGEVHSPLLRALAPLFFDPEATARTWLDDLARRLDRP
jgi:uncharacterized protein YndB with AHSA1/START domain